MARGKKSKIGDTRVSANGYHYTRTEATWELTHRLVARRKIGRDLDFDERVSFIDGDRTNIHPDNLEIRRVRETSVEKRKARIEARIEELQAQLNEL